MRNVLVLPVAATLVVGGSALVAAIAITPPEPAMAAVLDAPFDIEVDCGSCDECWISEFELGHFTEDADIGSRKLGPNGAHPDDCQSQLCTDVHPLQIMGACDDDDPATEAVALSEMWRLVRVANGQDLQALLSKFPKTSRFVPERNALQLLGCDGEIVAHVPLTAQQADGLQ